MASVFRNQSLLACRMTSLEKAVSTLNRGNLTPKLSDGVGNLISTPYFKDMDSYRLANFPHDSILVSHTYFTCLSISLAYFIILEEMDD